MLLTAKVGRQALAELLGTALLVATVIGSGIAAQRLSPHDTGLQLLENSLATGAVLVALIVALGPVSAAFNPLVSIAERVFGAITTGEAAAFVAAQTAGGILGAITANAMFDRPLADLSRHVRSGSGLRVGELVATFGLVLVVFGVVRSGRTLLVGIAVGGYITAAYWFTSSTSFANPAVTIARMFSDTFAGIAPRSVPMFVVMQVAGATLAVGAVALLYPRARQIAIDITHLEDSRDEDHR